MNRVLILAYYFPPMAVSGSMRPAGFCTHLREFGYEPHVLSNTCDHANEALIVDDSLLELIPADLRIDRVGHTDWMQVLLNLRQRLRRGSRDCYSGAVVNEVAQAGEAAGAPHGLLKALAERAQSRFLLFPDRQTGWIKAVRRHVRKLSAGERPALVFATGNPWSSLVAGMQIAEALDVPLVSDFRDPWTQNPKPPRRENRARAAVCERRIIHASTRVIANTDALRESFAKLYPDDAAKITTITNGYHENLRGRFAREAAGVDARATTELHYFGSVYELRKPTRLLLALWRLVEEESVTKEQLCVQFTGHWGVTDPECNRLVQQLEESGVVRREESVPHEQYLERLTRAQYLLVLQQDFPLQIPAKIYEYIASRRPLIIIGGAGATADLINGSNLGQIWPDEIHALTNMLASLVRGETVIQAPEAEAVANFGYRSLTRQLADEFDAILSASSA